MVNHVAEEGHLFASRASQTRVTVRTRIAQLGERIPLLLLASIALTAVVVLLLVVAQISFQVQDSLGNKTYSLANFRVLYTDSFAARALTNTAVFAAVSMLVTFGFAIPIAWLAERTTLPGRGLIFPLLTITLLLPGFFTGMGWIFLLHERIGIINRLLVDFLSLERSPINIVSVVGMGWVEGIALVPVGFIMIAASFRAMDPVLEESARVHGVSFLSRMRRITLPLMTPSILAAAIYVLGITMAAFDIPAVIGLNNRIYTFSTFVWTSANSTTGAPSEYGVIGASSAVMLVIGLFLTWRYMVVLGQSHRYAVVRGKDYQATLIDLGWWAILAWVLIGSVIAMTTVLPLLALAWVSFIPYMQVPSAAAFQTLTLDNFRAVPWGTFMTGLRNSAILFFSVPTISIILGLAISWIVVRSRWRVGRAFDVVAFLPHVIPHLIFAVGAYLLVIFWLPPRWGLFERSIGIIMIVYIVTRISFVTRMFNSGLVQIHEELDEAGYVAGLGPAGVIRKILAPLLSATILYTWLWSALLTLRELTVAAFLSSRDNQTLPVVVFGLWRDGRFQQAAAAFLAFIAVLTPLILLYFVIGRGHIRPPD